MNSNTVPMEQFVYDLARNLLVFNAPCSRAVLCHKNVFFFGRQLGRGKITANGPDVELLFCLEFVSVQMHDDVEGSYLVIVPGVDGRFWLVKVVCLEAHLEAKPNHK